MILFCTIAFGAFGLIIGSFLNVVVYRLNTEKSLGGRSACMSCRTQLAWYDLLPVLSFIALAGRCRTCKIKISIQYPLVELATGAVFAGLFYKFQNLFFLDVPHFVYAYAYYAVLFAILIVIAAYDLKHKIIPDTLSIVFGMLAFVGIFLFTASGFEPHAPAVLDIFSGLILAAPFALIWLLSGGRWMGLGDAKLTVGLGYLLGLGQGLSAIVVAFWAGALAGIALMALSKKGLKSEVPFAPFLVLGAFIAFMCELHLFAFAVFGR